MAGLRNTPTIWDIKDEPIPEAQQYGQGDQPLSQIDAEYRGYTKKGNLNPGDPRHKDLINNIAQQIQSGLVSQAGVENLAMLNPNAAPLLKGAYSTYLASQAQNKLIGQYVNPGSPEKPFIPSDAGAFPESDQQLIDSQMNQQTGRFGLVEKQAVPAKEDYAGLARDAFSRGQFDLSKEARLAGGLDKQNKNGLYGGIRTGIIPGTNRLIEYAVDENTGQTKEIGTGKVLVRGKDYEPTVGVTNMPILGGGIQSFPNRGGINTPLPSSPTGVTAMPTEGETKQYGQGVNAQAMGSRLKQLVESGKVKVGPVAGRMLTGAAATGIALTPEDAELSSLEENYSNALLSAMRGAQVGPLEQERFDKSLPRRNQPKSVFLQNVKTTLANIERLSAASARLRATPALPGKQNTDQSMTPAQQRLKSLLQGR